MKAPTTTALLGLGADSNFASVVPIATLAVSTNSLLTAMNTIYNQAVTDNIEEGYGNTVTAEQADAALSEQLSTVNNFNSTTQSQVEEALVAAALAKSEQGDDLDIAFKVFIATTLIKTVFNKLRKTRKAMIVDSAVLGPYNQGLFDSASSEEQSKGVGLTKQWISLKDESVRVAHRQLHGDKVPVGSPFFVNGVPIRFPKDPLAPPGLTINCRCVLKFTR